MLTAAGYNWFSIDYRKGGISRAAESVDDLRVAIEFIRCHAKEFRIDPNNIALLGEDTGAQMALMAAAGKPDGVRVVVSIGGVYDQSQLPTQPTLVIHGANDREVTPQQAGQFCEAMREAGRVCEYLAVDGAIHRAENWLPSQWGYKGLLTAWLARQMKLAKPDHQPYVTNLKKDIVFSPRYGLKLDAYLPPGKAPRPAVIIVHGGGWEAGDKVTYVTPLFEPLAKAGFAWFSIDYRLTPRFRNQEQLEDLRRAIEFVRLNSDRFQIDPNRIAILGESASGQMVAQLATEKPAGVAAVVSFYGVYDFLAMDSDYSPRSIPARLFRLTRASEYGRQLMVSFSPIYHVKEDMPPLLLIHGTNERLLAQGVAMAKKLEHARANYDFIKVENAPHGIENWEGRAEWLGYKTKLVEWLNAKLR